MHTVYRQLNYIPLTVTLPEESVSHPADRRMRGQTGRKTRYGLTQQPAFLSCQALTQQSASGLPPFLVLSIRTGGGL